MNSAQLEELHKRAGEARGLALMDGRGMAIEGKDLALVFLIQIVEELLAALKETTRVVR